MRQRPRELGVQGPRIEAFLTGAAEVDLDRVEPPSREAVGVLLVVAERADALTVTAATARVGVDPGQQAVPMQPVGQPAQPVRPLTRIDDQLAVSVPLAAGPAEVEPHDPVAGAGQAAVEQRTAPPTGSFAGRRCLLRRSTCSSPCRGRRPARLPCCPRSAGRRRCRWQRPAWVREKPSRSPGRPAPASAHASYLHLPRPGDRIGEP